MSDEVVQEAPVPEGIPVKLPNGTPVYYITQEEKDEAFYGVIALMSWSKTFTIPEKKMSLTFTTISDEEKHALLARVKDWAKNDPTTNQFENYMTKIQLAYYLSAIEMNGNLINLRDQDIEKRIEYFGRMVEQSLIFYNMYYVIFMEIVRNCLMDPLVLKN